MKNSVYATAAGMMTTAERLNVTANNIANFSTNGYKADIPFEQTLKFLAEGPYPGKDQPVLGGTVIDMQPGLIKDTERDLDIAIEGPGFFAIQGPGNQEVYTRNGAFNLNSKREIVTPEGFKVLDKFDREITLFGEKFQITPNGEVFVDGNFYTSLKIVDIPDSNNLEKMGDNFFKLKEGAPGGTIMDNPDLHVGALEKSNVNVLKGIGTMLRIERAFELQKTAADVMLRLLRKTITDIPKPV